jgi:CBS domain-containing membrane protein
MLSALQGIRVLGVSYSAQILGGLTMSEPERYGIHKRLVERLGTAGDALYLFGAAATAMVVSGLAALLLKQPFLFPSLGPTLYLFFETPMAQQASPRNTLIGHFVALLVGFLSVWTFGLLYAPSILEQGATPARVGAAAVSLALTEALLILLRAKHAPAGATVLIVSLGLLSTPRQVLAMAASIVLLTLTGWLINRISGAPMPVWSSHN